MTLEYVFVLIDEVAKIYRFLVRLSQISVHELSIEAKC